MIAEVAEIKMKPITYQIQFSASHTKLWLQLT